MLHRKLLATATLLLGAHVAAAPPSQDSVSPVLGPKLFRDGDVIEILDVTATSQQLEQGDTVTVKGRARLDSRDSATLSLLLTQTEGDGAEETDVSQTARLRRGLQDFELKMTIKHRGVLHLTFYGAESGKPFGGVYFGTVKQMKSIRELDLRYYLEKPSGRETGR